MGRLFSMNGDFGNKKRASKSLGILYGGVPSFEK
jgi:hypothetical protein